MELNRDGREQNGGIPQFPEHLEELRERRDAEGVSAGTKAQFNSLICLLHQENIRYHNKRVKTR